MSARSEILSGNHHEYHTIWNNIFHCILVDKKRSLPVRSASQRIVRPSGNIHFFDIIFYKNDFFFLAPACCADCKRPLLSDINARETLNKSRAVV